MKIPVFLSYPKDLNKEQEEAKAIILEELANLNLEPRTLGRTDYPVKNPLYEVLMIARHCAGGMILGFCQIEAHSGKYKRGTQFEEDLKGPLFLPTPWNNLEAGILFATRLPLLIFKEEGISGGVFDPGVTDVYVHKMPIGNISKKEGGELKEILLVWQTDVRRNYYGHYGYSQ
jgi:hypothetical protein